MPMYSAFLLLEKLLKLTGEAPEQSEVWWEGGRLKECTSLVAEAYVGSVEGPLGSAPEALVTAARHGRGGAEELHEHVHLGTKAVAGEALGGG